MSRSKSRPTSRKSTAAKLPKLMHLRIGDVGSDGQRDAERVMPPGWNDHLKNRAGIGIRQSEAASKLIDALPHPAFAIVTHSDNDSTFAFDQAHAPVARSGMPEHVRQRFLDDTEDRGFDIRLEPTEIGRLKLESNLDPATIRKPFQIPAKSGNQANLVQQRRVQKMRNRANLLDRAVYQFARVSPRLPRGRRRIFGEDSVQDHLGGS